MPVTITQGPGATVLDQAGSVLRHSIDTETSSEYSWVTPDGDKIILLGSFTYPGGAGTDPSGTVAQIQIDIDDDGIVDMTFAFDSPFSDLADLLSGDTNLFWQAALSGADTFSVTNPTSFFGLDGRDHSTGMSSSNGDIINVFERGFVSGDYVTISDSFVGGADTFNVFPSNADHSQLYGDAYDENMTGGVSRGGIIRF